MERDKRARKESAHRFFEAVEDFGGVGFRQIEAVGLVFGHRDFQKPVGDGVAAFVLPVEGVFPGGNVGKIELAVGGGFGPVGGGVGRCLAEGLEIQILVAVREVDAHAHGIFLPVGAACDGEAVSPPSFHPQPPNFRNQVGGGQDQIHAAEIGAVGRVFQLNSGAAGHRTCKIRLSQGGGRQKKENGGQLIEVELVLPLVLNCRALK